MRRSAFKRLMFSLMGVLLTAAVAPAADMWKEHLEWAARQHDGPNNLDCAYAYLPLAPDCIPRGRACAIDQARTAAKYGYDNKAMDLVMLTQCHNSDARAELSQHRAEVLGWLGYRPQAPPPQSKSPERQENSGSWGIVSHGVNGSTYSVQGKNGTDLIYFCNLDYTLTYQDSDGNKQTVSRKTQVRLNPHTTQGNVLTWPTPWAASTLSESAFASNCFAVNPLVF